jgi:hypothetical protein
MTEKEEHCLSKGINSLHDEGAVHASDIQKLMKYLAVSTRPDLQGLSGQNFLKAIAIILVSLFICWIYFCGVNLLQDYGITVVRDLQTAANGFANSPLAMELLKCVIIIFM